MGDWYAEREYMRIQADLERADMADNIVRLELTKDELDWIVETLRYDMEGRNHWDSYILNKEQVTNLIDKFAKEQVIA